MWLQGYHGTVDSAYLLKGFKSGFRIPYQGPWSPFMARNLSSVKGIEHVLQANIDKE